MLILTRKKDQRIMIGEGADLITITLIETGREKIRLGIEAPRGVPVHREEVYDEIQRERRQHAEGVQAGKPTEAQEDGVGGRQDPTHRVGGAG